MRIFIALIFCLMGTSIEAQKNTAFFEVGGMGGFASLNYEWQFGEQPGLSLRVGVGLTLFGFIEDVPDNGLPVIDIPAPETVAMTVPVSLEYLFDLDNNNYLETGVGSSWQYSEGSKYAFFGNFGFRRYFGDSKNWMWKVNFTPLVGVAGKNAVKDTEPTIWGGVSIGKRF